MAQKVQLTKKQAKAMDSIKNELGDKYSNVFRDISTVIDYKINGQGFIQNRVEANTLSDADFILALTVGYEVKKTAEEIVEDIMESAWNAEIKPKNPMLDTASYNHGVRRGILDLRNAGIKFTLKA
ncbi:hypothetical protein [Bacillus atrophaeus]|uniref:Phage protein n=1 Tax=Bacillus atrophaeus (strain 1942) TaxID=720555 RepID=A0ABM5LYP8_BACA1|nr:hypothetical protein [Bacillus atrophaeus]AMR62331.1 hypothetical protein A1D11_07890 [Bacillus subtilis subsp. globigii]ADP32877.1 hypothetical protein BATR1942_09720 [Bacillus atrophaeus 1942]AIK49335.1 hypothetical protein DJ95_1828 [Bacillus atrophaeus subsp. globigii]EIM12003.1 hypothetical protein UY9_03638 [Bacillus atrophaeus C89]KFK83162.1 hypothetical protein DK44_1805 [Bacillus atrophaeus]